MKPGPDWRFAVLAGATAGLLLAPAAPVEPPLAAAGVGPLAVLGLVAIRPRGGRGATWSWLGVVFMVAALAGLLAGGVRLPAIHPGAPGARPGAGAALHRVLA